MPQSRVPQLCHLSNLASLRELSIRQAAVYVHVLGLTQLGALTLLQVGAPRWGGKQDTAVWYDRLPALHCCPAGAAHTPLLGTA